MQMVTALGLQHMKTKKVSVTLLGHELELQKAVAGAASVAHWAEDYIGNAVKDVPYASAVWAGIAIALPLLKNPVESQTKNQEGFEYVTSQMRYYAEMELLLLPEQMDKGLKSVLADRLVTLYKLIIEFQVATILLFYRRRTTNYVRGLLKYDGWEEKLQAVKDNGADVSGKFRDALQGQSLKTLEKLTAAAETMRQTAETQASYLAKIARHLSDSKRLEALRDLRTTNPKDDKQRIESDKGGLLSDVYEWILENPEFKEWRDDHQRRLLWIKGDPGKGKTMLICGIINELERSAGSCLSYFFCQATETRLNSSTSVLRGLMYMLINRQPWLAQHVQKEHEVAGRALFEDSNAWVALSNIFKDMLEDPELQSTLLVVDALDECERGHTELLQLIRRSASTPSARVKWIVSSRYSDEIEQTLGLETFGSHLSLELNETQVARAVDLYIERKAAELPQLRDPVKIEEFCAQMREKASGTFLWVAIVVNELRLRKVSSRAMPDFLKEFPAGLSQLYGRIMSQIQQLARVDRDFCLAMLSRAAVACRPLTLLELGAMAGLPDTILEEPGEVEEIVKMCGSFLTIRRNVVYLVHQSARDYLTSDAAPGLLGSGISKIHYDMFWQALAVMNKVLKRDIYGLRAPGCSIEEAKAPQPDPLRTARYACMYWVDHLEDGGPHSEAAESLCDGGAIDDFLQQKYLYWIESLSLLRRMSKGVLSIAKLVDLLKENPTAARLVARARDAHRFLLTHRLAIESWPLQIYVSALVFSPAQSITRQTFEKERAGWILTMPSMDDNWNACQQTLEGDFSSIAFSSLGALASGSSRGTVKIWNPATGRCRITLDAHTSMVFSLAFSNSGLLASGSTDKTIKLWDDSAGVWKQTLQGHIDTVVDLAFPSTKLLASASYDGTIKVWEISTGECVRTLGTQSPGMHSAALSRSEPLAAIYTDEVIKIYNILTGQCQQSLRALCGQSLTSFYELFPQMALSSSGSLASASSGEIWLWDIASGHYQNLGISNPGSLAFMDSGHLLSGSNGGSIKLWDPTGKLLQTTKCHTSSIYYMALMPNSTLLASSTANVLKLWDIEDLRRQSSETHSRSLLCLVASKVSGHIATRDEDGTIRLWDAHGQCQKTYNGHGNISRQTALSRDASYMASGSESGEIQLWNLIVGGDFVTLKSHSSAVTSLAFSSDSKLLASGSQSGEIRLWNLTEGGNCITLKGHSDVVILLVFSPDTKLLASHSKDTNVRVWDFSGKCRLVIESYRLTPHAFSPDSSILAVYYSSYTSSHIKLWAIETGLCQKTIEFDSPFSHTPGIVFSPDGCSVAWSMYTPENEGSVRIWDIETGHCRQVYLGADCLEDISFDTTGKWLHTDMGVICLDELPNLDAASNPESSDLAKRNPFRFRGFGRDATYEWILKDSKRLLWLPPDYRSYNWIVRGSTVTIVDRSGDVLVFSFAPGELVI